MINWDDPIVKGIIEVTRRLCGNDAECIESKIRETAKQASTFKEMYLLLVADSVAMKFAKMLSGIKRPRRGRRRR